MYLQYNTNNTFGGGPRGLGQWQLNRGSTVLKYSAYFNLNFCRDLHLKGKDTTTEKLPPQNHYGDYTYAALPSYYPHPSMAPPLHPPQMYTVPMIPVHPGYGPWPVPQAGFSGFYNGPTYGGNVRR